MKLSLLSEPQRLAAINAIIDFFATEREEEIGIIAAEDLLDFFLENIGARLYNHGVDDTKQFVQNYLSGLETEIEVQLKKDESSVMKNVSQKD